MTTSDSGFAGSIPELYDRHLRALLFEPYARDLAKRVRTRNPEILLEVAAGTGIVTRQLERELPTCHIEATDLSAAMVDHAVRDGASSAHWSVADAQDLPFEGNRFDVVACQFGVMFFPDRKRAFREAYRVLKPGGAYIFSVWDRLERNRISLLVSHAAQEAFPENPPLFFHRVPFAHNDPKPIEAGLLEAGFAQIQYERVELQSQTDAHGAAVGLIEGTPLRNEIEQRDPNKLSSIVAEAARRIREELGDPARTELAALVFTAQRTG